MRKALRQIDTHQPRDETLPQCTGVEYTLLQQAVIVALGKPDDGVIAGFYQQRHGGSGCKCGDCERRSKGGGAGVVYAEMDVSGVETGE